ncbi:PREDICTED: ATP-dependent DNA helicase Q4 [Nipponia nippon]|uniref:ATP-dependent DNA helicase Q4 n=1 Tax=Nipponia nippon TaxID=128390 RepID=UPI000510AE7C|nr:PREDICTED: ATP-dependent DNA helicase Q4 [Nipponia nippon]
MERQREVKALLKRWEAAFLRERRRKPGQADIEEAPEETRRLYREYKALKRQSEEADPSRLSPSGRPATQETPTAEQVPDSGCWGAHLNRQLKTPGPSRPGRAVPKASAQYYGMKLKSKLGAAGKETPLTPRRTPNPRRPPIVPSLRTNLENGDKTPAEASQSEGGEPGDLLLPPSVSGLAPIILAAGSKPLPPPPPPPEKIHNTKAQLKRTVARTLGSLDPAWLQRCQGTPGDEGVMAGATQEPGGREASVGDSGRKRPRGDGGDGAAAPAKLRRCRRGSAEGEFGAAGATKQSEEEEEEERVTAKKESEVPRPSENLLGEVEEEEKPGSSRRAVAARAAPQRGGNFVRLNLKKKSHVRGYALRGNRLRKQARKQKWQKKAECFGGGGGSLARSSDVCFSCGGMGHWAAACRGRATPEEVFAALKTLGYDSFRPGQEMAVMRILSGLSTLVVLSTGMGKSLCYQLPAYLYRKRSKCVTLVVSPLVSLMDDQVSGLPPCLKAVCIHSNMTKIQREAVMEKVRQGEAQVLLLSPEALVGGSGSGSGCLPSADRLPPVAFACIDEAHCVSEWSHNFRPCYLRLCQVLRDRLGVRCFLGLTATATLATARDVAQHLGIPPEEGITVRSAAVPPNLRLSVSMDRDRDQALISLLRGERFGCLDSIIVYCTRREETARVAALIRTCLQGTPLREPAGAGEPECHTAEAYHAGLSAAERRRVQSSFMSGQLRVVVATVAFGMGLDKSDVRGVVHYNMPKNFESYVQEIGRAGRDGEPAHCHLFLDPEGGDLPELRRHIYGDTVDFFTVKKLVQKIFSPCKCLCCPPPPSQAGEVEDAETAEFSEEEEEEGGVRKQSGRRVCYKHERAIPIQETVESLDVREEGIETLLCYLELHPQRWLELLPPTYSSCRLLCYGGPRQLQAAARSSPPVAAVLAREHLAGRDRDRAGSLEFDVVSLSNSMGWEVPLVKRALRQLQWDPRLRQDCGGAGKSGVLVEFGGLSFHLRAYGDLSDQELDAVCDFLHRRVVAREKTALGHLRACFRAFQSVAFQTCDPHPADEEEERSARLKALLSDYFETEPAERGCEEEEEEEDLGDANLRESQIRADIRHFLAVRQDEKFSGRAVARIFHGIVSSGRWDLAGRAVPPRRGVVRGLGTARCLAKILLNINR